MKHILPFSLFESISSDRRAFQNWLNQRDISEFDEDLFQLFIKHRSKLDDKNIFNYTSKSSLNDSLYQVSKNVSVKKFEKDIRLWNKLDLNCDILYQDENYVVLHAKDFESERKLSSGCNICTNHKPMYDGYLKSGAFLFDILDLKNNQRYFGTYTHKHTSFQSGKKYNIVNKKDILVINRTKDSGHWKDSYPFELTCSYSSSDNLKKIATISDKIIDDLFFKEKIDK